MNYENFTKEDLLADQDFIQWVKSPNAESDAFWKAWISQNPLQEATIREARKIVLYLDFKVDHPAEGKLLEVWEKIMNAEKAKQRELTFSTTPSSIQKKGWWLRVAASIAIVFTLSASLYYYHHRTITLTTAYGESRTLFLPDSTKVTLNSNTKLTYSPFTFNNGSRTVKLDGEAFFAVVHTVNNEKFMVHTSELVVEVLGTRFNVNSRRGKSKVVLEEGMVRLNLTNEKKSDGVVLKPGELAEFSLADKHLTKKTINTNDYVSWKNNELVFVSSTLDEVASLIEDNYGFQVEFLDQEIGKRKFTGSASSDNVQDILEKLSKLFGLDIEFSGNKILIKKDNGGKPLRGIEESNKQDTVNLAIE